MTTGTYVVCLDCGKEFAYDWEQMKVLSDTAAATGKRTETSVGLKAA